MELSYDPAILLQGIYLEKTQFEKIHAPQCLQKHYLQYQPNCPSADAQTKMWHICTMEYYSAIKKDEITPFAATHMDLEIIILSEVSQTEKDK